MKKVHDSVATAVNRPRQRHSDRIEYRRGRRDGEAGLAAASLSPLYVSGYSEGRRVRAVKARAEGPSEEPPASSLRARFPHDSRIS